METDTVTEGLLHWVCSKCNARGKVRHSDGVISARGLDEVGAFFVMEPATRGIFACCSADCARAYHDLLWKDVARRPSPASEGQES